MQLYLFILYFNIMLFNIRSSFVPKANTYPSTPAFKAISRPCPQVEYETWV